MEIVTIGDILVITRGNQTEAAELLKMNRGTFRKYMLGTLEGIVIKKNGEYRLFGRQGEPFKK